MANKTKKTFKANTKAFETKVNTPASVVETAPVDPAPAPVDFKPEEKEIINTMSLYDVIYDAYSHAYDDLAELDRIYNSTDDPYMKNAIANAFNEKLLVVQKYEADLANYSE